MPDIAPEAQAISKPAGIREDIAAKIGLDPQKAAEIAKGRAQEEEVIRTTKRNGAEAYDQLNSGQEVDSVKLGIGQFDLSPTNTVNDLVPNLEKRISEINPAPPQEHIKLFLDSFASKALDDKNFEAAVACYNYITDERLGDEENTQYIEKLSSKATTDEDKYDLYLALQQVLPQTTTAQEAPQAPVVGKTNEPQLTIAPASAESIAADETAWREAAGVGTAIDKPETIINAPLQPDASLFSPTPQSEPQPKPEALASTTTPAIEVLPPKAPTEALPPQTPIAVNPTATEQTFPQPQPIKVPNIAAPEPFQSAPITTNGTPLRPVPTREEAAARGLIDDIPTTPSISSSEAELVRAA